MFVEKPPGTSVAEVEALAELGAGRLFVMHKWRYHPGVLAIAALVEDGALGAPVTLKTIHTGPQALPDDVDVTWHLAVHDLAIALEVLGLRPTRRARRWECGMPTPGCVGWKRGCAAPMAPSTTLRSPPTIRPTGARSGVSARSARRCSPAPTPPPSRSRVPTDRRSTFPLADEPRWCGSSPTFLEHCAGGPAPKSSMTDALASPRPSPRSSTRP